MKKISILILMMYSFSYSIECEKIQIDELKYMKKNELIETYKKEHSKYQLNLKFMNQSIERSDEFKSKGDFNTAILFNKKASNFSIENICHAKNKDNIKRVLEKDFKITENEFNKLVNAK